MKRLQWLTDDKKAPCGNFYVSICKELRLFVFRREIFEKDKYPTESERSTLPCHNEFDFPLILPCLYLHHIK